MLELRQKSEPTTLETLKSINFVERVKKSLGTAWTRGYGLAGVQIGVPLRAAWFRVPLKGYFWEKLLWNPEIVHTRGILHFPDEGCLSIPGKRMTTVRHLEVTVKNGDGEIFRVAGVQAVVLQHEIDHMNGVLCTDHILKAEEVPGRNDACPCGSGKKFKKCCYV